MNRGRAEIESDGGTDGLKRPVRVEELTEKSAESFVFDLI